MLDRLIEGQVSFSVGVQDPARAELKPPFRTARLALKERMKLIDDVRELIPIYLCSSHGLTSKPVISISRQSGQPSKGTFMSETSLIYTFTV